MKRIIAPSLLSADFGNLERDLQMVNQSEADWFHCDIMDGVFVPNISFGFPVMKFIKKHATKPLDVHLMITQPERYVQEFKNVGADILTVHYEACTHLHRTLQSIKEAGMKAGISLNPHTPVSVLKDIVHEADMVLIMSVNPGYGGQKFIEHSFDKIKELRQMIIQKNCDTIIQVDGGVDASNVKALANAGVESFVAGSSVFAADDPSQMISILKNA